MNKYIDSWYFRSIMRMDDRDTNLRNLGKLLGKFPLLGRSHRFFGYPDVQSGYDLIIPHPNDGPII